ncbi:MAG: hypothetical protein JNL80_16400 [Phycisphaerae bacterium]|nr:hypothetical protein [Phycisphaerae bacterium]
MAGRSRPLAAVTGIATVMRLSFGLAGTVASTCGAVSGDAPLLAQPLERVSCPGGVPIEGNARTSFGHSVVSHNEWVYVGTTGAILRYRVSSGDRLPSLTYVDRFELPASAVAHLQVVGMWIAKAGRRLYASRGLAPMGYPIVTYNSDDIAHLTIADDGTLAFEGWIGVEQAGVVRTDGKTLVAPLPLNGWPAEPTTPGILVVDLDEEGAPDVPLFVAMPNAGAPCRAAAVSGDWIAIGVPTAAVGGVNEIGRVGILHRTRGGVWQPTQWIECPPALAGPKTRFGMSVAIDGPTLVVGAPMLNGGLSLDGGAAIYRLNARNAWTLEHVVPPDPSLPAGANHSGASVAVHGDLVAIGGAGFSGTESPTGVARLFRRSRDSLELLLTELPAQGEQNLGRSVSFVDLDGESHLLVGSGPPEEAWAPPRLGAFLLLRSLTRELADCDGDGLRDGAAIDLNLVSDCDGDRIPDSCQAGDCDGDGINDRCGTAVVVNTDPQPYPNQALHLWPNVPPASTFAFFTARTVPSDASGFVSSVRIELGRELTSGSLSLGLYADPNQDGDPQDALLRWMSPIDVRSDAPVPLLVDIPPTLIGPPDTRYFVALIASGGSYVARSWSDPVWLGTTFYGGVNAGPYDLEHPGINGPIQPAIAGNAGLRFRSDVFFRAVSDVNEDRIPDDCLCPADLDASGAVDAIDLALLVAAWTTDGANDGQGPSLGDIDRDGLVGAMDLALLLGAWSSSTGSCG